MIQNIGHIAIRVRDIAKAVDFYTRVLGGRQVFEGHEDGVVNLVYVKLAESTYVELFISAPGMEKTPSELGFMHLCLVVPDIYEAEAAVKAAGWPAKPVRRGKYGNYQLWLSDPDGTEIEFMQLLPDFLGGNA